jgi:hypothetical protein
MIDNAVSMRERGKHLQNEPGVVLLLPILQVFEVIDKGGLV